MRKHIGRALGLACLILSALILMNGPALAQQNGMRMEIPVQFLAGNTVFPAGMYVVRVDERFRFLEVTGENISGRVTLAAKSVKRGPAKLERGSIALAKYGDTYVLRNVWRHDETEGWALVRSTREIELAKANPAPPPALIAEGH